MDSTKWECVLVEWVNCLKLSNSIENLQDLRDGAFLSSLMKLISPDHKFREDTLTSVFTLLKKEYPGFTFENESCVHLQDLPVADIATIASLLMHFSCILDRRDVLTSPLCHQLSKQTQLLIRTFLEKMESKITKDELVNIIEQSVISCKLLTKPPYQWISSGDSSNAPGSPLQELLRTPASKSARFQEKDRIIAQLRSELELEHYDKGELQEQLKLQTDHNAKLGKQVAEKSAEVTKLRRKLENFECTCRPNNENSQEHRDQLRILRSEIETLEKYATQLRSEQEELQDEKDAFKEMLDKKVQECAAWKQNAIITECSCESFTEKCQRQEMEIDNLRAQCTELTALLEELKAPQTLNDSCADDTFVNFTRRRTLNGSSSCEDLACSVVEVQLKDCQKENVELKALLTDAQVSALSTQNVLEATKTTLAETVSNLGSVKSANEALREEISALKSKLEETETALQVTEDITSNLKKDLATVQLDFKNLQAALQNRNEEYEFLRRELDKIQQEHDRVLEKFNKTDLERKKVQNRFEISERNTENSLQKLKEVVYGNNTNISSFDIIAAKLQADKLQDADEKKLLNDRIHEHEQLVAHLQQEIAFLREREVLCEGEKKALRENVEFASEKVASLESNIKNCNDKINSLIGTISELNLLVNELESLKITVAELQAENKAVENDLLGARCEITRRSSNEERLQRDSERTELLRKDLEQRFNAARVEIEKCEMERMRQQNYTEKLENSKICLESEIEETKRDILLFKTSDEELKASKFDLERNLAVKQNEIAEYTVTLEDLESQKIELGKRVSVANMEIMQLKSDIEEAKLAHVEKIDALNRNKDAVERELGEIKEKLSSTLIQLDETRKFKQKLKSESDAIRCNTNKKIDVLSVTVSRIEYELQTVTIERDNLLVNIDEKVREHADLEAEVSASVTEHDALFRKLDMLAEKLKSIMRACHEQSDVVSQTNKTLLCCKLELQVANDALAASEEKIDAINLEAASAKIQVELLKSQNSECTNRIKELEGELVQMRCLKEKLEINNRELDSQAWNFMRELSEKNDELNCVIRSLERDHEKKLAEVDNLKASLEESKKNSLDMKKTLLSELNDGIAALKIKEAEYIEEIRLAKDELGDTLAKYTEILENQAELKAENDVQVTSLTENLHSVVEKYNNLDKIYADTVIELSAAQERIESLEDAKITLEIKISEEKDKYEADFSALKNRLQSKIEELESVVKTLEANCDGSRDKVERAEKEKEEVAKKLELFSVNYEVLQSDMASFKIDRERELYKNENEFKEAQTRLMHEIQVLRQEAELHTRKRGLFEQEIVALRDSLERKGRDVQSMEIKNKKYADGMNKLLEDQKVLREEVTLKKSQIEGLRQQYGENSETVKEHEITIVKLKCAIAILETGKEKLQVLFEKTTGALKESESSNTRQKQILEKKENEITVLSENLESARKEISAKNVKLDELNCELSAMNNSFVKLVQIKQKLEDVRQTEVAKIHADYEGAVKQHEADAFALKTDYDNISEELKRLRHDNIELKDKIKAYAFEKCELENNIKQKENELVTVHRRTVAYENEIEAKNVQVRDLNDGLHRKIDDLKKLNCELESLKRSRAEIIESQSKMRVETENSMAHAREMKNDILKRLEIALNCADTEKETRAQIEILLRDKSALEIQITELNGERGKISSACSRLIVGVNKLCCMVKGEPSEAIVCNDFEAPSEVMEKLSGVLCEIEVAFVENRENEKIETVAKLERLQQEMSDLGEEKMNLVSDYNLLVEEKTALFAETDKEQKRLYDSNRNLSAKLLDLERQLDAVKICDDYKLLVANVKQIEAKIKKIIADRNSLENILNTAGQNWSDVLCKTHHITEDSDQQQLFEKKQALQIIYDDIRKHFNKITRSQCDLVLSTLRCTEGLLSDAQGPRQALFDKLDIDRQQENVDDCSDRVHDVIEQLKAFEKAVEVAHHKHENKTQKPQKENVLKSATKQALDTKAKEDEWKKKSFALKQRLTLSENAKSCLEKKIRVLREESRKTSENDELYKNLVRDHAKLREEYEKLAGASKLLPEVGGMPDIRLELDLKKMRDAYGNLMSDHSKTELENGTMRKLLEERTSQLSELGLVKEAYEKLLEENSKLLTEVDTVKYKRSRDRDEYIRLLKKEKDDCETKESRKIREIRNEYEAKLEKMKEKMIKLYKEEVDKELQKIQTEKTENVHLTNTIELLREDLRQATQKYHEVDFDRSRVAEELRRFKGREAEMYWSRESVNSLPCRDRLYERDNSREVQFRESLNSRSTLPRERQRVASCGVNARDSLVRRSAVEERKISSLPRSSGMDIIEEVTFRRRTSVGGVPPEIGKNLEMEDEDGDVFNNKYLADLKEGRCALATGPPESNTSRLSELQWRNSMLPPHLKSSYPAETQFHSPGQFREDDVKAGNVDLDDSMSSKLLPGEKHRRKDVGTTSYKKPGPPTPSKNGGRVSLQGSEVHPREILRELNEAKTPKRTTPNRLKALFMGRTSIRDNSENQPGTPKSKRLSIFRKSK